jgi:DNA-binding NtrC family response regulator
MTHDIILYIFDPANDGNSLLDELKKTGCEIVSTNSPKQGVALLYIMHPVTAVVLDGRARKEAGFDVAQSLRQIRPDVPLMLTCDEQTSSPPSGTDLCVSTAELTARYIIY